MAVEDKIIRGIDRRSGRSNNPEFLRLIQAYWDELRPLLKKFKKKKIIKDGKEAEVGYSWQDIAADEAEIQRLQDLFENKGENAIVGEIVIMDMIYQLQLMTEDVEVFPTSDFDDIKRGIDFVLRFGDGDKFAYLGVDVKTTNDQTKINEYRERVLKNLRRCDLGNLKYFEDEDSEIFGQYDLPMIVIPFNPEDALVMEDIMLKMKKSEKLTPDEENKVSIIKQKITEEITKQIEEIVEFLKKQIFTQKKIKLNQKGAEKSSENMKRYSQILDIIKKEALN